MITGRDAASGHFPQSPVLGLAKIILKDQIPIPRAGIQRWRNAQRRAWQRCECSGGRKPDDGGSGRLGGRRWGRAGWRRRRNRQAGGETRQAQSKQTNPEYPTHPISLLWKNHLGDMILACRFEGSEDHFKEPCGLGFLVVK